jgi:ribosomal protein L37E
VSEVSSVNPFRDLYDAAVRYASIKFTCRRCGHATIVSTHALWYLYAKKGWADRFKQVQRRSICMVCWFERGEKVRNPDMEFGHWEPTDTRFPMPSEFEWKAEMRRRR